MSKIGSIYSLEPKPLYYGGNASKIPTIQCVESRPFSYAASQLTVPTYRRFEANNDEPEVPRYNGLEENDLNQAGREIYADILSDNKQYNYRDTTFTTTSVDEIPPELPPRPMRASTLSLADKVNASGKSLPQLPKVHVQEEPFLNKKLHSGISPFINATFRSAQLGSRAFFYYRRRTKEGDKNRPHLTKRYPIHPGLKNRFYFSPVTPRALRPPPLHIDIHGGAWITCDPSFDDSVNRKNAENWMCNIVSLDYTKAPDAYFPTPVNQLVDLVLAVLNDKTLNYDPERVSIGGFSAGATLALGVVQDPRLQGRFRACLPFYPITDWSQSPKTRAGTRPYDRPSDTDLLLKAGPLTARYFNYVYCQGGADLKEPRLSPFFARREDLPEWIFTMGAEYDILCNEAAAMMGKLAERPLRQVGGVYKGKETETTEGLLESDKYGFEADGGRLKWKMYREVEHGWTHTLPLKTGYAEIIRMQTADDTFRDVGEWLWRGPYKIDGS